VPAVRLGSATSSPRAIAGRPTDGSATVAGFDVVDFIFVDTDIVFSFDPGSGALVAIVGLDNPDGALIPDCLAGPAGFFVPSALIGSTCTSLSLLPELSDLDAGCADGGLDGGSPDA
jgi:hypothetical protein